MFAILLVQLCVATKRSVLRSNPESGSGSGRKASRGVVSACSGTIVAAATVSSGRQDDFSDSGRVNVHTLGRTTPARQRERVEAR